MSFELFDNLTAYFSRKSPSFIIKLWQVYGGKLTFVPAYKKPDIWFGMDKRLIKKKNALHVRWIYDSILFHRRLPFDDYYTMNRLSKLNILCFQITDTIEYLNFKLSHSNRELKKEQTENTRNHKIHELNELDQTNSPDISKNNLDKNLSASVSVALPFTPIQLTTFSDTLTIEKNTESISSASPEKIHYFSSTSDKCLDLLSTPYQETESVALDKSITQQSLHSLTKSVSSTGSSLEILSSPIERVKVIALEDLESAVDIFEVVAAKKPHDQDGILKLRLK